MKNLSKRTTVLGLVLFSSMTFLVFGNVGNVADNETLRTQIRYNASEAGVALSNIWTNVQSDRQMVIFGGTLSSTQQLYTLFNSVTEFSNFIFQVQQSITTPEGNPYPQFFSVGFSPYKTKKKTTLKTEDDSSMVQPETTQQQTQQPKTETKPHNVEMINFLDQ